MAELNNRASVLTIDGDFAVYRKHGRRMTPLIAPGLRSPLCHWCVDLLGLKWGIAMG